MIVNCIVDIKRRGLISSGEVMKVDYRFSRIRYVDRKCGIGHSNSSPSRRTLEGLPVAQ